MTFSNSSFERFFSSDGLLTLSAVQLIKCSVAHEVQYNSCYFCLLILDPSLLVKPRAASTPAVNPSARKIFDFQAETPPANVRLEVCCQSGKLEV